MASKSLFSSSKSVSNVPAANTVNAAGGKAYLKEDRAALAQFVMTGCFNNTYYTSDKDQLARVLELANKVEPEFLAKLAVYGRQKGLMKDMPAVLAAILAAKDSDLLSKVFDKVIDDPKMLRNFMQIVRSQVTGRKSFGSKPKKLINKFLSKLTDEQLFKANIGNDPSLSDIIKMVHPKPSTKERNALYAYLLDKEYNAEDLCDLVKKFEAFKKDMSNDIPNVPFQMLTALPLTKDHWKNIAKNATWNQIRMNLNSFSKHEVFSDKSLVKDLAKKLQDEKEVKRAKVFPYQLFTTYMNMEDNVPNELNVAIQKAAEVACSNIPEFDGDVYVMVDVSGSMSSPATGSRGTATSKMRCIDVAALFASAILRKNPNAKIIPFDTRCHDVKMNCLDSIMTNAKYLSKFGGGGTNCSLPLKKLNAEKAKADLIIYISDNESYLDDQNYRQTGTMKGWVEFKMRNRQCKLVNIDIQPHETSQTTPNKDILNIGGFSDSVFDVISKFVEGGNDQDYWIKTIESVQL